MASTISNQLRVEYCGGRPCPLCHKSYAGHLGPLVAPYYRWRRRDGATCGYRSYPHYVYYIAYHGGCSLASTMTAKCPPFTPHHDH
ncbi:unnamed protein product, partial [Rotaria sp. Silwood2]